MKTKEIKIQRQVTLWIEDFYEVPKNWTEEDILEAEKRGDLEEYFEQREILDLLDTMEETGNIGIK